MAIDAVCCISAYTTTADANDDDEDSSRTDQKDSSTFMRGSTIHAHTNKSSPLTRRFLSAPPQQYALVQPNERAPAQRPTSKGRHRRLSNCIFYAIFSTSILSLTVMELVLRMKLDHENLAPRMVPRSDYAVAQTKGNGAKLKEARSTGQTPPASTLLKEETSQEVKYPNRRQLHHSQTSHVHSSMKFTPMHHNKKMTWALDSSFYTGDNSKRKKSRPRVFIDPNAKHNDIRLREASLYPAAFSDNTQLYMDKSGREIVKPPYEDSECVPMAEWQTASYPTCNEIHQMDGIQQSHPNWGGDMHLFGTNGYWRDAWKIDYSCLKGNSTNIAGCNETVVLKTLKFQHNFEHDNYEHDRIDAMAMERLTSSPHVINIFGACGNSVITEFADGERVGTLADTKKKIPLARLEIARDIASGLADVHMIDGNEEATFVHFDVNLANVVSVGGRLKLNDFNIGVILKRNVTSGKACGFAAQYPNPQWRSPEEANGSQHLSEKVDVFSLGHIFFRLICLHEPWHKLEPGYTKGDGEIRKQYVNEQVKKGILPAIPKEVMETRDAEVSLILQAMLSCYTHDPEKRPSARSIANFLDRGLAELSKHDFLRRPGKDHWGSFRLGKKKKKK